MRCVSASRSLLIINQINFYMFIKRESWDYATLSTCTRAIQFEITLTCYKSIVCVQQIYRQLSVSIETFLLVGYIRLWCSACACVYMWASAHQQPSHQITQNFSLLFRWRRYSLGCCFYLLIWRTRALIYDRTQMNSIQLYWSWTNYLANSVLNIRSIRFLSSRSFVLGPACIIFDTYSFLTFTSVSHKNNNNRIHLRRRPLQYSSGNYPKREWKIK